MAVSVGVAGVALRGINMCWYCHWGVPKPVSDIYYEALDRLNDDDSPLLYGPSHVVWEDFNLDDRNIKRCIEYCDLYEGDYTKDELMIVKWSLQELLKIPESQRDIDPSVYDEDNTPYDELPPPTGVKMVRI